MKIAIKIMGGLDGKISVTEQKHIRTFRSKKLHPEHVKLINEAIRHNARGKEKDVHITYRKENGEVSERKVRPLAVKGKSLFVAHCHERNAIRSFRVERITMVKKAFWEGFEKRALSHGLLSRAAESSLQRAKSLSGKEATRELRRSGRLAGASMDKLLHAPKEKAAKGFK